MAINELGLDYLYLADSNNCKYGTPSGFRDVYIFAVNSLEVFL